MIKAFQENAHLRAPVFVQIGVSDELTELEDCPEGTESLVRCYLECLQKIYNEF